MKTKILKLIAKVDRGFTLSVLNYFKGLRMYKIGDKLEKKGMIVPYFTNGNIYKITGKNNKGLLVSCDTENESAFIEHKLVSKYFNPILNSSNNNGGSTDYYKFKENWKECQDIIEDRGLNFSQGNIFKSAFCFNIGRHNATDYTRELNKIIYFCNRELKRIEKDNLF